MKEKKCFCEKCYLYPKYFKMEENHCFARDRIGDTYLREGDYRFVNTPMQELNKDNNCSYYIEEKWWMPFSRKRNV